VNFHKLQPREPKVLNDLTITPYQLDHPDPCWGLRCESGGKVFSHCVDTEGTRVSRKDLDKDLPLYQNADLAIYDAQYSFLEAAEKIDWGHASGPIGIDLAAREKIKKILFIHHDPAASDEKVHQVEEQTRAYYRSCVRMAKEQGVEFSEFEWCFAREGMVVEL
jgi:phosphoribosyl 1,2-cyclic phosphodiesterase